MKFSVSLILVSTFLAVFGALNETQDYGLLIKDVHDKYGSAGVVIIASKTNYQSFEKMTIWHGVARSLFNEGISTRIINFRHFKDELKIFNGRNVRLLIVIVVDTLEELNTFESLTKDLQMTYAIWLMWFTRDASREICGFCRHPHGSLSNLEFGSKVLVSCCGSNMLEEWYTESNRTKRQELGRLRDGNLGIRWISHDFVHARRYSMDGQTLRIAAVKRSTMFREKDGEYYGLLGELLKELSQAMNFTLSRIIWEDDYGAWNPKTSNFTGVIGRIHRREADIGAAAFFMTSKQYDVISFTAPIAMGQFKLHVRKHDAAHPVWNAPFKAFAMEVWVVIIGLILTTPILLMIIKYRRKSHFFPLLFEQYLCVWGIYCQQSSPAFSEEAPSRIIYLSIFLSALVTSSAYSASMISSYAMPSYPPFNTMEQFVEDGSYKLIVLNNSLPFEMHKFPDQTLMRKLMALMKPKGSHPRNAREGFEQICRDRVAFYVHELAKKDLLNVIPCEITSIETGAIGNIAMIMSRGSIHLDRVNYQIQQFRTKGFLRHWQHKYHTVPQQKPLGHPPVNLSGIASIVFLLAFGFLISFIIFIIERNVHPSRKKLRNQKTGKTLS